MSINTVDITEWTAEERAGVDMTLPYEVISSPYGETITVRYATEAEAMTEHDAIAAMTGEYLTSWGHEPVNTEATILHYTDATPTPAPVPAMGSVERVGIRKPWDMSDDLLIGYADAESDMVWELYDTTDCIGVIVAAHSEAVGLVTYYRAHRSAEAYAMIPDSAEVIFKKRGFGGL